MKTICSWCGKMIQDGETQAGLVSHGMCAECARAMEQALDDEQQERAWAREALNKSTPRCVLEQLADGMAPIEAVAEAMTLLRAISEIRSEGDESRDDEVRALQERIEELEDEIQTIGEMEEVQ